MEISSYDYDSYMKYWQIWGRPNRYSENYSDLFSHTHSGNIHQYILDDRKTHLASLGDRYAWEIKNLIDPIKKGLASKEWEQKKEEINRITDKRLKLYEYLFGIVGPSKFNEEKFIEFLNILEKDFKSEENKEKKMVLYDPIMRSMLLNTLTGETLKKYQNLVIQFDESIDKITSQRRNDSATENLNTLRDYINGMIDSAIFDRDSKIRKMELGTPIYKRELELLKEVLSLVNTFFDSINISDFVQGIFNNECLNNYNELMDKIGNLSNVYVGEKSNDSITYRIRKTIVIFLENTLRGSFKEDLGLIGDFKRQASDLKEANSHNNGNSHKK